MSTDEKRTGSAGGRNGNAAGNLQHLTHEFGPLFDEHSRILILGSFPSVKSREQQFYYGHPQNRFWKIMAAVCAEADLAGHSTEADGICDNNRSCSKAAAFTQETAVSVPVSERLKKGTISVPKTISEKRGLLLEHGIALWDVIESCDIRGSSDASIRNVRVNDLAAILHRAQIRRIYINGGTAYRLYEKYMAVQPAAQGLEAVKLPSTSPANAAWSLDRLFGEWEKIAQWEIKRE